MKPAHIELSIMQMQQYIGIKKLEIEALTKSYKKFYLGKEEKRKRLIEHIAQLEEDLADVRTLLNIIVEEINNYNPN